MNVYEVIIEDRKAESATFDVTAARFQYDDNAVVFLDDNGNVCAMVHMSCLRVLRRVVR